VTKGLGLGADLPAPQRLAELGVGLSGLRGGGFGVAVDRLGGLAGLLIGLCGGFFRAGAARQTGQGDQGQGPQGGETGVGRAMRQRAAPGGPGPRRWQSQDRGRCGACHAPPGDSSVLPAVGSLSRVGWSWDVKPTLAVTFWSDYAVGLRTATFAD
jgi:hypothetical protein